MKKRGFTLLELVLCISIASVLILIPLVKFSAVNTFRANQDLKRLINDINFARNYAVFSKRDTDFILNKRENSYKIVQRGRIIKKAEYSDLIKISGGKTGNIFKIRIKPSSATVRQNIDDLLTYKIAVGKKNYILTITFVNTKVN